MTDGGQEEIGGAAPARAQRQRLVQALAENADQVTDLEQQHARFVEASKDSNADDEHDPEGATIAFEREQVTALLDRARSSRAAIEQALARVDDGRYGTCERCGGPIAPARLEARPEATTCIACAAARR
ncbi:TraR/DksA C4-type zinc finger protein [Kineosporia sp. R_H_3]|uniref:TraR/DksA family transcriptional regulator n=1 Tax=Kineosporia sp. R_H_3 TaxID=1961848 RepID=UPI0018EA2635|nr:TraR/DksA C4-type zinc finger protein [Kineosporia sp. R_H_3]